MARTDWFRREWALWLFPLLYAAAAIRIYGTLGLLDNNHLIGGLWSDPIQQSWFLSYWQWSVAHVHVGVWTDLLDHPLGINVLDNTSFPLLGLLASPLTWAFGPFAVLGLLFRLALFLSSLSAFLVLRRLIDSPLAAGIGGLMYGFCPSLLAYGQNWMHLTFMPLPPVMLYLLYRGLTDKQNGRRYGLKLAAVTIVQCGIESEIALDTLIAGALTVAAFGLARFARRSISRHDLSRFVNTAGGFALVASVPLALLAWAIMDGRSSFQWRLFPIHSGAYSPLDILLPSPHNYLSSLLGIKVPAYAYSASNGGYIGIPIVLAFIVIVVRLRGQAFIRAAAAFAVICWVLTLGGYLTGVGGTVTSIPLPFTIISRLPIGGDLDGTRFTPFVAFGVAVVVAAGIDALVRSRRWWGLRLSMAGVVALGVVMAIPMSTLGSESVTAFAPNDVNSPAIEHLIPRGGVVLTQPYSNGGPVESMLWQAATGMHFKVMGGYAIRKSPPGYPAYGYPPIATSTIACLLMAGTPQSRGPTCQSILAGRRTLRAFVKTWDVSAILVQVVPGDTDMLKLLNGLYPRHAHSHSIYVWSTR